MSCCGFCLLRADLCICQCAPRLSALHQWVVLTHTEEIKKATNTGKLLLNSLPNAERILWSRRDFDQQFQALTAPYTGRSWLLFPDLSNDNAAFKVQCADIYYNSQPPTQNQNLMSVNVSDRSALMSRPNLFVIIDATWQQARKMYRQSTLLQELPKYSLMGGHSDYTLRRHQQPGNLSTVETGIQLLQQLGHTQDALSLAAYFEAFLHAYEAHRSDHSFR